MVLITGRCTQDCSLWKLMEILLALIKVTFLFQCWCSRLSLDQTIQVNKQVKLQPTRCHWEAPNQNKTGARLRLEAWVVMANPLDRLTLLHEFVQSIAKICWFVEHHPIMGSWSPCCMQDVHIHWIILNSSIRTCDLLCTPIHNFISHPCPV